MKEARLDGITLILTTFIMFLFAVLAQQVFLTDVENKTPQKEILTDMQSGIYEIIGNKLYFDVAKESLLIEIVFIDKIYCTEELTLTSGINEIDLSNCISKLEKGEHTLEIYTKTQIIQSKIELK